MTEKNAESIYSRLSIERKELQEKGLVPKWYTTGGYQLFKDKYEYETEGRSVRGQFERIAKTAAKHLKGTKFEAQSESKFFEMLWEGYLSPSTPVMANTGTNRGLPVSCSGTVVTDSIEGFYENLTEVAMLTKNGFGTASDLSNIRPRGSKISIGGKASGVVPVIREHIQTMRNVAQGTARRGAWACYLNIDHGDFFEVSDMLLAEPDDFNIGWTVNDSFIDRLNQGDKQAVARFQRAMKIKMVSGKGYFFFVDKANAKRPQMYVDKDLTIKNSQLCVAPETLILTDEGYQQISELENEQVNVWNGKEFSLVTIKKTGENQKLIRVVTNCGFELECTPYHKFYVALRGENTGKTVVVEKRAIDLKPNDKLIKGNWPVIEGTETFTFPYANGFYTADGCLEGNGQMIYLYHGKQDLLPEFSDLEGKIYIDVKQKRTTVRTNKLLPKFFVPSGNYTIDNKMQWFAGLCDGDGTVTRNGKTQSIQVGSINKVFLQEVQMMLQTLGVSSKVTKSADEGFKRLPLNNGSGESGEFWCQNAFRLLIGQNGITTLIDLGFSPKRLKITDHVANRECTHFAKIEAIVDDGRVDDTFCFTEPKRGLGVFNGILTGQCSEIMLHNDDEHTYTCVLSSINTVHWDKLKDSDTVYWATIFLDCIASEFIECASNIKWLEKAVRSTVKGRPLGLGQCGFHTLLMRKMIPFEGFEAHMLNLDIAAHIAKESKRASEDMAKELGEPEWCEGYSVRNTHLVAIAPTKSSALLMGGVSEGINPDVAMTYTQLTAAGSVDRISPVLLDLMKKKGVYSKTHLAQITDKQGSVQHVDWLTDEEKAVFKTAFEINQEAVLRLASTRAKYIDQWQSLNLFFAADEDPAWIAKIHQQAFCDPSILALYYIYTQAGVQASKDECVACQ